VLDSLVDHRDLGIHTELLSDGIVDLVDRGVVTNTHKTLRPNKVVTTFALGTQRLYDWMHDNMALELLPVDYVNDPRVVAREDNFVSINATTEVDLYGQCASETIAGRYWSLERRAGGLRPRRHVLRGGQAFIVLHSTTSSAAAGSASASPRDRSSPRSRTPSTMWSRSGASRSCAGARCPSARTR
jgi:hypothetical protein